MRRPPKSTPMKATAAPPKNYEIVGLQPTDQMPVGFNGRTYDLANLTEEDAAYLLGFPEQVPFIKPASDANKK